MAESYKDKAEKAGQKVADKARKAGNRKKRGTYRFLQGLHGLRTNKALCGLPPNKALCPEWH